MSVIDHDLETRLRAARAELPELTVDPWFTESVRARAWRRTARLRAAGVAALVAAVVAGVAIPAGLLGGTGHKGSIVPAKTPAPLVDAVPWTYGGITVTWLPAGTVHVRDGNGGQGFPGPMSQVSMLLGYNESSYSSTFMRPDGKEASTIEVGVNWMPDLAAFGGNGDLKSVLGTGATETTVRGQQAFQTSGTVEGRYEGGLYWREGADGPLLGVSTRDVTPIDWAEIRGIAEGLRLDRDPGGVDPATVEQVKAAFSVVYGAGEETDEAWLAAVQDGAELIELAHRARDRYPQLVETLEISFSSMRRLSPTSVQLSYTISFIDDTVPAIKSMYASSSPNIRRSVGGSGSAVLVDGRWMVSRESYCAQLRQMGDKELVCS
ncbi:hypothetical protein I6A84_23640 [Frankia sp. CNm7]|uniref:Uncharacterized protein n=1 Tax=Frankia nepalensis TaxID=1836974 RepID=A0A937R9D5_9ACTN|nr:hypothetical protein [Frankia nepalensis]MBL7496930.1 hypothetical protein [Frankia nepalensis]MBL7508309.1 hypothetical protein [Frankia nepalensis]MBL7520999.1 hypothetical protein [Frankia nepalensis]MBL7626137.1 hypothetical protein [Frankia nepalensis]